VVRERHAHAWCLAWINQHWQDVDTTPASWSAIERSHVSIWEPVRDFFSRAWFEFSRWRWGHAGWKRYLLWLIVPLLALAVGKLLIERQWSRARRPGERLGAARSWPGRDSEFYLIQEELARIGVSPQPGETGSAWLRRVARTGVVPAEGLEDLLAVHYRLRFDPRGLTEEERHRFHGQVGAWLGAASAWVKHPTAVGLVER
jgi:protein-glutamine gamma-glutamyltransferase